jgi:hypothetical protein
MPSFQVAISQIEEAVNAAKEGHPMGRRSLAVSMDDSFVGEYRTVGVLGIYTGERGPGH